LNFFIFDHAFLAEEQLLPYWQLSQPSSKEHAFGLLSGVRSTLIFAEAETLFIHFGWSPRLLISVVDFSIWVAALLRK
jgi:hypothetical protein